MLKRNTIFLLLIFSLLISAFTFKHNIIDELAHSQKTPLNNSIYCYKKGYQGKKILLIGSMHGNEKAGIPISIKIMNAVFEEASAVNTLICIPSLNPDGNILNKRGNSNNIDINRNFPATNWILKDSALIDNDKKIYWGGQKPASEEETKFILKLDSLYHFNAVIVLHQFMNCVEYDGPAFQLAAYLSYRTGQELKEDIGYSTAGSLGSYFGLDKQVEVITIEIPKNPSDTLQENIANAITDIVVKGY
ncbi:MAG TPA: DUF2817 domain-containing protein [Bacteroidales bacterium]|nr:DUF2817 domain-containing protein [Bacteroidales bacterium]HQH19483.1 DUF2817 domain-containing protein [Bacteroidales bacterium]HQI46794.1 DUF2817 domain-containing protein [Bacteroidales bacterium]